MRVLIYDRSMKQLADSVWHLDTVPMPNAVNAFVIGDVLVDAGGRRSARKILRQLDGHEVSAHAITHAHPDHQGASDELCTRLQVPYMVGERDVPAAMDSSLIRKRQPDHPVARFYDSFFTGPGRTVDRVLRAGDEVAGFEVIDVPGHSAGHIAFWRAADGVLVAGDVVNNMDIWTGIPGLHEPKPYLTPDPVENRRSIRKIADLEPKLLLVGHGPPFRNPKRLSEFAAKLGV
ncbi:MAG: hydroxyacylglutathione hydrolase [Solirubrobacterales bacterium]|jgi:glyoxylase-like metal-dependent hydrolase (beta-lactamase superfamily II)|nr:hydroxyacylglutathione hydrolase [Solirubrobacterales bacterium]